MTGVPTGLEAELRQLRKGEGIFAGRLAERVGPRLRLAAEVADGDSDAAIRRQVSAWLGTAAAALEPQERLAVAAAFALSPVGQRRYLNDRLCWLAAQLHCDARTARRRMDEAIRRLAAAQELDAPTDDGWYVASFTALVRLDRQPPESMEEREIVATVDGLAELVNATSVPRHPDDENREHDLGAELLFGGTLGARAQPYESYFEQVVTLPVPLAAGERHVYVLRQWPPPGQPMAPHYVYVPLRRCDAFTLRIRFDPRRPPRQVWRFDGVPTTVITERRPNAEAIEPDRFGELSLSFRDLRIGRGYGTRWEPVG